MPFIVVDNKPVYPTDVCFFSAITEMIRADYLPDMI
jgi:hypothetical protein